MNLAKIEKVFGFRVLIKKEEWVPGIWCGVKNYPISIFSEDSVLIERNVILSVDLENRILILEKKSQASNNDLIFQGDGTSD